MKIFGANSLSAIAFYIFRAVSMGMLLFVMYIDYAFMTNKFTHVNGRYHMDIPFTGTFIKGDYQFNVILTISITLFFATIFFFILSNIFKAFSNKVIFNQKAIVNLKLFTIINLIVGPILYFIIHFPIMQKTDYRDVHNLILHFLFGMIALFITHIVKKGYKVQEENDLTI